MNESHGNIHILDTSRIRLTQLPSRMLKQPAIRGFVCLVLIFLIASPAFGQTDDKLPTKFVEIIAAKEQALKQYAAFAKNGPSDKAVETLGKIVALHRQALKVAIATKDSDEKIDDEGIKKLRKMLLDDSEFYSNQLLLNNRFEESGIVKRELEKLSAEMFGKDDARSLNHGWDAIIAEKLAVADKEVQTEYLRTFEILSKANQSRDEGRLDAAEALYEQVSNAVVAVVGESHPKVALVANGRGIVAYSKKDYDKAERFYKQAIRIRIAYNDFGMTSANTQWNLGLVYFETEKYPEAEKQFLAAAAIQKRELGETASKYIGTLQKLAAIYKNSGESEKLASVNQKIAAADPLAIVMRHLPKEAFAGAAMSPSDLPRMNGFQLFPFEVFQSVGLEEFGIDPMGVESVVAFATIPVDKPPLKFGFLFKLKYGTSSKIPWLADMKPAKTAGGEIYRVNSIGGRDPTCFYEFDDGVLFFGNQSVLAQTIASDGTSRLAASLLSDKNRGHVIAAIDVALVRPTFDKLISEQGTPPLPPQLTSLIAMPADTERVRFWLNMSQGLDLSLILDSTDQTKATRNAATLSKSLEFLLPFFREGIQSEISDDAPLQVALRAYADRVTDIYFKKIQPQVIKNSVLVNLDLLENQMGGVVFALVLPAIQAARGAAGRMSEMNQMRQIALAMHNYHHTHRQFPTQANYDKEKKPLLSWRVHLLPFLEEPLLYSQFKLDEPWDSPTNLKLAARMPKCYRHPTIKDPIKTVFMTTEGEKAFMDGNAGLKFASFLDGSSNTIMLVEANPENACIWTQPVDLPFDPDHPKKGVGLIRPEGFHAAFVDGSVHLIPATVPAETLRRLIIRDDGEIVDIDFEP